NKKYRSGITLVEIMVSMLIVVISVSALYSALSFVLL
ncbi:MAG: prepilin-type N-terminal cleavage/methylation domain-containing protein, partial [Victivallaceae bacterium]|nr:prepilin-type N-terminal cleavage/methylation domain-containing protein [Victivallaceae bacterium]